AATARSRCGSSSSSRTSPRARRSTNSARWKRTTGRRSDARAATEDGTMIDQRKRWLALVVLCLGDLMIVLDSTVVNVALPSIREDLGFSQTALVWVVNAYMLTFGGFLLL